MRKLHNGAIKDFNIMTRSAFCQAKTTCGGSGYSTDIRSCADTLLVFAASGELKIEGHLNKSVSAPADSLVVIEPPADGVYSIAGDAFIAVEIFKTTQS